MQEWMSEEENWRECDEERVVAEEREKWEFFYVILSVTLWLVDSKVVRFNMQLAFFLPSYVVKYLTTKYSNKLGS